jgi:hypothetical protein
MEVQGAQQVQVHVVYPHRPLPLSLLNPNLFPRTSSIHLNLDFSNLLCLVQSQTQIHYEVHVLTLVLQIECSANRTKEGCVSFPQTRVTDFCRLADQKRSLGG